MAIRSGIDAQLGIVDEVTYGTPVTVTRFLEFVSESMQDGHVGKVVTAGLGRSRFPREDRVRTYPMGVSGSVEWEVLDTGFGLLLKYLLGGVVTAGAGPDYTHTLTPDANALFGTAFTMQIGRPGTLGTVHPFTYGGCKVTGWNLSCAVDEALKLTTNIHAQNMGTGVALASKSYAADSEPFVFVDGALTVGGAAVPVRSFSMDFENGLNTDRRFLGSGLVSEPIANAIGGITGTLDAEFEDLTELASWAAGTQAQLILTFDSLRTLGSGSTYKLTVTIPLIEYTGSVPSVGGPDIVRQSLPFRAFDNGSAALITMVYETSDAAP